MRKPASAPRLIQSNPSYRRRHASGQAVVTLDGRDVYLGPHGTKASRSDYDHVIGEWLANVRPTVGGQIGPAAEQPDGQGGAARLECEDAEQLRRPQLVGFKR